MELAATGLATFSLRTLAAALGKSTRVLTHHFTGKEALLSAVLVGTIMRDAWRRHLSAAELPRTRLVHEIEGLAAAGRLAVPAFVSGRARFVAAALELRGLTPADALTKATLLNNAYSGLQADHLTTGESTRTEAALAELCTLADSWT